LTDVAVALDRVIVDASRRGVVRARVTVTVESASAFSRAVEAFLGRDSLEASSGTESPAARPDSARARGDTLLAPGELDPDSVEAGESVTLSDLEFKDLHRLDIRVVGPGEIRTVTLRPEDPWETREDGPYRPSGDAPLSLSGVYGVGGLYRDTNQDLVPDETAAYLSLSGAEAPGGVVDLATRIGLETAGIRLPLARVAAQEDDPSASGLPVMVGTDHYQIQRLREEGKLPTVEMGAGEGFVQVVDDAFGDQSALTVGGGDASGLEAVTAWLARRAPYLWRFGKGEYRLADVETEVRRFLQARSASGQVALALAKLAAWMDRTSDDPPARVEVELSAIEAPAGLAEVAAAVVGERFPEAEVDVQAWPTGFGAGDTIFVQDWEISWEVDEVRALLETDVYPNIRPGWPAAVVVRVSEPPEIRVALAEEIRVELLNRGADEPVVHVLSAYKQGFSWIHDVVLPRLRDEAVGSVDLTYHTLEESEEVRWQTIAAETRWLQEVYPIDAILARELGIPDSVVTFHPTRTPDPIYKLEVRDTAGAMLATETFNPKYVVRPFFDLFPEYEQVRVTTGWIEAHTAGDTLLDQRIVTDPERFWDRLQTETYGEIIRYVMDIQDGNPSAANAPYFDELRVDLRMSEPDYRIGVDEETISSLEALHEDIFFETHTLFNLIGGRYQTSLPSPGRILPFVDPTGSGRPGHARISLTGKERGSPELIVRTWREGIPEPLLQEYDLSPLPAQAPRVAGVTVEGGAAGLQQLLIRVTVTDSLDRYDEFSARSREGAIDRQFLSAELLEEMLGFLGRLHGAGILEDVLSWDRVGELALDFRMEKDSTFQRTATLPRSGRPKSTDNPRLTVRPGPARGGPLVQWETPISPQENEDILARLGAYPEVSTYYLTDSYLGHRVWAADFLPPYESEFVSQAKLNALRPTLFVSGREHANEVSSTSHILRLGELLVTDSTYRAMLDKVNVVLHPMANPDGAALAYERQLVNPDHMLHAGRPGALGVDATSGERSDDPVYPESQARRMIREAWLPDVYLNPHGYPSHEWVQYFAGYSAWARGRRVGPRTWWVPRGWFIPGFSWVEDEENPGYETAQFAILDSMAAAMTGDEEVDAMNRRLYARYKKYGVQDRDGFTEYFHNGMVVSMSLRGAESVGTGLYSPRITYFGVTTEAPDETARGDWMKLMGRAGLAHTSAVLRYLATGEFEVTREAKAFDQAITRKVFRVKPVLPAGEGNREEGKTEGGGSPSRASRR
ncbi:M14 family metallopeptidase, partial [Gemmatimonadota bacterium]